MQKSKMGVCFPAHGFNFYLQSFVFGNFVTEKAGRDTGFGFEAGGSQDVSVAGFVGALFKIFNFYPPFGNQGFEAVVYFAETDTHGVREIPLREIGVGFKGFEDLVGSGIVKFGFSHGFLVFAVLDL